MINTGLACLVAETLDKLKVPERLDGPNNSNADRVEAYAVAFETLYRRMAAAGDALPANTQQRAQQEGGD